MFIDHFERRTLWFGFEGGHFLHRKLAQEKRALVTIVQCRAGVVFEATRADGEFTYRRRDVAGLSGPVRKPKFLVDPRTIFRRLRSAGPAAFFELPIQSPAGIAALSDIDEPFAFLADVTIVIYREQIAELVECQLLYVAQTCGKHLEVAAIPIAAQHTASVRVVQEATLACSHREAVVANGKIEFAIGTDCQPVQVVTIECGVYTEPVKEHLPLVCISVVIGIVQPPHVGINSRENITAIREYAGHHAVDFLIESLGEHFGDIRLAIVVRIL